mmetsp:Transcript_16974/g.44204  ORF Transcript_16974/g.44204 Transcript_16974/m.44204 type:complete len:220 (+) Transcript_16974:389-1048(+)
MRLVEAEHPGATDCPHDGLGAVVRDVHVAVVDVEHRVLAVVVGGGHHPPHQLDFDRHDLVRPRVRGGICGAAPLAAEKSRRCVKKNAIERIVMGVGRHQAERGVLDEEVARRLVEEVPLGTDAIGHRGARAFVVRRGSIETAVFCAEEKVVILFVRKDRLFGRVVRLCVDNREVDKRRLGGVPLLDPSGLLDLRREQIGVVGVQLQRLPPKQHHAELSE